MKPPYFLILATLANATPRIAQISPSPGLLTGTPVAWDIDNDGDLDLAYLGDGSSNYGDPYSSSWIENLGNRTFSAPRFLGHQFNSTFNVSRSETLIRPFQSEQTFLFHHTTRPQEGHHEIFSKTIHSNSWNHIHNFHADLGISFLQSPVLDSPFFFSHSSPQERITYWTTSEGHSISQAGQITIPETVLPYSEGPDNFQAIDLDQDGDSDLLFEIGNRTLIYERTGTLEFSETPSSLDVIGVVVGDLNLDGRPDLFSSQAGNAAFLGNGDLTFTSRALQSIPGYPESPKIGILGEQATFIKSRAENGELFLKTYQVDASLQLIREDNTPTNTSNISGLIVSDFDQDGNSDVAFISRSTPSPRPLTVGGITEIPFLQTSRPRYDLIYISWGTSSSLSEPTPAYREAPVICEHPAIADFNGDGYPDLIVGPDTNGQARLLLNDGRGHFPRSRLLTELQPELWEDGRFDLHDFVPVDINNDGNMDLSITVTRAGNPGFNNTPQSACAIAMGDGTGHFSPVTLPSGSFQTIAQGFCSILEFHDWDDDGDLDAILPGAWRENLDGTLRESAYPLISNAVTTDALGNPVSVPSQKIIDIDGDGYLDIIIPALTRKRLDSPQSPGLFFERFIPGVGFNSGNGAIENISEFDGDLLTTDALGNPFILSYIALDLDLDGRSEILIGDSTTDALGNPFFIRLKKLKLDEAFPRNLELAGTTGFPAFSAPLTSELLDFNGDGELEYVAADQYISPTARGPLISPQYNFIGDHLRQDQYPLLSAIAVADFDQDGDIDALYARGFSGLHLVRNTIVDEDSPITMALTSQGLTPARATPQADADGDGRSNALEIIHGTDPLTADQAPSDVLQAMLSSGQTSLEFTQLTNAADLGVFYDLESSSDLTNWSRIMTPAPVIQSTHGIWSKVSMEIPQTDRKIFYRISAVHDPRRP